MVKFPIFDVWILLWFPRPPWVFLVKSSRSQAEKKLQASEEAMKALAEFDTLGSSELR